jgi:hypothetical protein
VPVTPISCLRTTQQRNHSLSGTIPSTLDGSMHLPRKGYFTHPSPDNGRSYRCARATATSGPRLHIHCHTHTHTVHLPLALLVVSNFPSAALVMQCKFSSRRPGFNCYWSNKILFLREDAVSNCKGNFIVVIHARARRRRRPHVEKKIGIQCSLFGW